MIIPDRNVNWYVDYNFENINPVTEKPVGTLRIPSFLIHNDKKVGSRGVLERSIENFKNQTLQVLKNNPKFLKESGVKNFKDIKEICLTSATELEFWVNTPENKADEELLSISQNLKEQYWKRTQGIVRTALEKTIYIMELYGFEPEMGHKEVGGIRHKLSFSSEDGFFMEQLEIDWKFTDAMQCADNELFIKNLVADIFNFYGLEVTFKAKPIEGVAGSGEHTHIGVSTKLINGKLINLFSTKDLKSDYLTSFGYGALMGILKNYEIINPFVTATNDALNRLTPGFEAPICIVTSLGKSCEEPSRNRSILIGLIKDMNNTLATRFELRSPNPHSNTYLVMSACYQCMLDGIFAVVESNKTIKELEKEISKEHNEEGFYLEKDRVYRSEKDVFEEFTEREIEQYFGKPPRTVWENVKSAKMFPQKREVLLKNDVFTKEIIDSYRETILERWTNELLGRIIPSNMEIVRNCKKIHTSEDLSDLDVVVWNNINQLRWYLMKDKVGDHSLFTRIKLSLEEKDFDLASDLQIEMKNKIRTLKDLYSEYKKNLF